MTSNVRAEGAGTILHVGRVSPFVDFSIRRFEEAAPRRNALILDGDGADWRNRGFIDVPVDAAIIGDKNLPTSVRDRIDAAPIIVLHAMSVFAARVALAASADSVVLWSGWGDDYYGGFWNARHGVVGGKSLAVVDRSRPLIDRVATGLKRGHQSALRRRAARRVTHFSAPIQDDFAVARSAHRGLNAEYLQINYTDVEQVVNATGPRALGRNILLGNSAAPTNNTLEAIARLARVPLGDRLVYAPLGYGHPTYRRAVVTAGKAVWGDAFRPLEAFMPLHEYLGVVQSCGVVVMNHWRQQAVGSLVAALHAGSRVVLNHRNPLFSFAQRQGIDITEFSEACHADFFRTEPGIDVAQQRAAVESVWGAEVVRKNYRQAIHALDAAIP